MKTLGYCLTALCIAAFALAVWTAVQVGQMLPWYGWVALPGAVLGLVLAGHRPEPPLPSDNNLDGGQQ